MPSHEDLIRDQFTRQAAPFADAPAIRDEAALDVLIECAAAHPGDTVLDVACGPGLVACAFAPRVRHATGIDLTPAMIERASSLAREKGLENVAWQVGDVLPLPFPSASFTVVVSRYSFHHFLDPRAVLAEMRRVSAPGGRVLVADVIASPDPRRADAYNRMEKLRDPSHARALPLAELEGLFREAGLPSPGKAFYSLDVELEGVLGRSFPSPGGADEVRRMFEESLADDGLGVSARREGGEIRFAYPIAVLSAAVG
jgi:SAM-dependent methyltransferase